MFSADESLFFVTAIPSGEKVRFLFFSFLFLCGAVIP